jgi:hypothetical protein
MALMKPFQVQVVRASHQANGVPNNNINIVEILATLKVKNSASRSAVASIKVSVFS